MLAISRGRLPECGSGLIRTPPILPLLVSVEKPAECPILPAPIDVGQVVEIRFLLQLLEVPQVFLAQLVSFDCGTHLATGLAGVTTVGIPAALCECVDVGKGLTDALSGAENPQHGTDDAAPQLAQTRDNVYCAQGRIALDRRSPDLLREVEGAGICLLGQFDTTEDAERFAGQRLGGLGAACSCR